jgi:hypothetical protein
VIAGFERGANEIRALWDFTQRRLVVSCPRFVTTVGGCDILTGVDEDSSHVGRIALSTGQFTFIFRANSPK